MTEFTKMEDDGSFTVIRRSTFSILKEMLLISVPASLSYVSQMLVEIINVVFIGHLGDKNLVAALGMGNLWINICGVSILHGLNSGVATFVSQSIGQNNLKLCGVYLNRGRVVAMMTFIPISIIMLEAGTFFGLMSIDYVVSEYSQIYITNMLPFILIQSQFDIVRTFLSCF